LQYLTLLGDPMDETLGVISEMDEIMSLNAHHIVTCIQSIKVMPRFKKGFKVSGV
jgi:hypothetical protein